VDAHQKLKYKGAIKKPLDEPTYQQALPFFKAGVAHFGNEANDIVNMVSGLVRHLTKAGMAPDAIRDMKPYIVRFVEDVQSGKERIDAPSSGDVLESDRGESDATPY
jgi:hypothetical protein